jgi:peptidoglycan/LPS O-acetylase OafA/YrhL
MNPPVPASTAPTDHLPALDGLRGLAILLVLFHHLFVFDAVSATGRRLASVAEFAGHGVDLFFALSGFLIVRQLAAGRTTTGFAHRFWIRRAAKIVPLYLLVIFGVFVLLPPLLAFTGHGEKLRWVHAAQGHWPWYLFFLSNVRNALDLRFTNPALDVAWSLAVEVQFYLLAFVMARWVAPARWVRLALMAIGVALAFRTCAVLAGTGWVPILVLTPGRLDAFAWGALAVLAPAWLARCPVVLPWAALALPVLVPWSRTSPAVEIAGYSVVALMAGVLIQRATRPGPPSGPVRVLSRPALVTLGRISYSVYLTHLPLRAVLRDGLLPAVRHLDTPRAWLEQGTFWFAGGLVCLLAGWLTWRFIEEPARQVTLAWLQPKTLSLPFRPA